MRAEATITLDFSHNRIMSSDAYRRFAESKLMDYEKWHDGVGYDLDALAEMTDEEREGVVSDLISHVQDWRDLEALHFVGTVAAHAAIEKARNSPDAKLRVAALRYGPPATGSNAESTLLKTLDPATATTDAIEEAANYKTPAIIEALLRCARECTGPEAYGAVASLLVMHGKLDSVYSWDRRDFILRFVEPPSPDRDTAYGELRAELGIA